MSAHEPHDHGPVVRDEQVRIPNRSMWRLLPIAAGLVGIVCLVAAFAVAGPEHQSELYVGYLTAYMTFLALSLGGVFFVLIQHASRAGWSVVVRRIGENMALTAPVMGLLALPFVFLGADELYHWTDPHAAHDPVLVAKQAYLNVPFFQGRAFVYIAIWALLGGLFWYWSVSQDTARDPKINAARLRFWSPVGLLLFGLSLTFAAFDWLMSLDPHWFSTIFGVYYFAGCVLSSHAFIALTVLLLQRSGLLRGVVSSEHFHDLGKMMFAFTVFWAYIGFSQYMLIWYASIPEETEWYAYRGEGDWLVLSIVLVFIRFVFPFLGLLSRHIKRRAATMAFWTFWVLVAQYVDMFWLIHPVFAHAHGGTHISFNLYDILTLLGLGGVWLAMFAALLSRYPLVPLRDPRLAESVHFENL